MLLHGNQGNVPKAVRKQLMEEKDKKPVLIVIAGPNGSGKVLRFSDGKIAKRYTEELPE